MRRVQGVLGILGLILCFCRVTIAQPNQQQEASLGRLSVESRAVLDELEALGSLPPGEWRYHAGDLAHGESPQLDDSAWEVRQPGSTAPSDSVWYRSVIQIPPTLHGYDLTGSRIWFQFRAEVNGPMTQIVYVNGKRVAMGDDLEPILLFENCKPGDKALVAVKLLQTVDQKSFTGVNLFIGPPATRPNPKDIREELLSAALLTNSLGGNPAGEQKLVDTAARAVDFEALPRGDQQAFDTSLRKSLQILAPLRPELQRAEYHLTGNSHIDAAWLWPWTDSMEAIRRTWGTALQLMKEYPNYTFTQSAAQYNVWMAEKYPQLNDEIKTRIREGRWEIVGGMWVEPDLNMPDGESLVRQLLIGTRALKDLYGVNVRIGWNPDSFGYNWQLPQIYKRSGIDFFVTQKMAWNDTNVLPLKLFWWQSPDGSKVLTYFPHNYDNDDFDPSRLAADLVTARNYAPDLLDLMDLFGIGDHGGGASRFTLDQADHWRKDEAALPSMEMGTAQAYFDRVLPQIDSASPVWNYRNLAAGKPSLGHPAAGKVRIPTWDDELYFEYHRGTYTTQAHHKENMRKGEVSVLDAEKFASLSWLDGALYPQDVLNDAWQKVLFNEFHDLAAGSGIATIYKDAQKDFDQVRLETHEVSEKALHEIQAHVNTQGSEGVPVFVFNSLAWPRSGIVTVDVEMPGPTPDGVHVIDTDHRLLPSQILAQNSNTNTLQLLVQTAEIPSMGYEVLHVVPGRQTEATNLQTNGWQMENAYLRVKIDPETGCLISLYNKKSQFEALSPGSCGNELIAFRDVPKAYDAWNIDSDFETVAAPLEKAESVTLLERTPLRVVFRVVRNWRSSRFVQDYVLCADSRELEVVSDFDWHEDHILLKAAFSLSASHENATYEIPFGSIDRPTTRRNSWESAKFEVPALRWADSGDASHGFTLINESKYGYDAKGNVLRISLLRSPTWPDPHADRGHQHFRYWLYPHAGTWQDALSIRRGYEANYGLIAVQVGSHGGELPSRHSFIGIPQENVVLTAVKKSEDSDALILRLYEWKGKESDVEISVPDGVQSAEEINLMEKPEGGNHLALTGDKIVLHMRPYEIKTVCVNYPTRKQ
ncbi:MAG TPA: glycoside hydrolase family 38 C-terminal domain-containing protein [Terriglobia bacterium]|jgi:alpha-mannosidase|nr:glycoside hydrolase family 38 C-terminal domain-containing protein [Terriglobia bacterium]